MKKLILAAFLTFSAIAMTACTPGETPEDAGGTGGDEDAGADDTDAG